MPPGSAQSTQPRPTHIAIPSPLFAPFSLTPSSSPDDPFDCFMFETASSTPFDDRVHSNPTTPSNELQFHTAPTSPSANEDPITIILPLAIPLQLQPSPASPPTEKPPSPSTPTPTPIPSISEPPPPPSISPAPPPAHPQLSIFIPPANAISYEPPPEDLFPVISEPPDITIDDEALSTLEKIYLFSRSKAIFHRIYIVHTLSISLDQVTPREAVEYVLPLLSSLATDEDESVKESLAAELVPVMWWFLTHCQLTSGDFSYQDTPSLDPTPISVEAFTPILGTLLLSPNALVGGAARQAVVDILRRIRRADVRDHIVLNTSNNNEEELDEKAKERDELDKVKGVGLFGPQERQLFGQEVLRQVVIGIGRLDDDEFEGVFTEDDWQSEEEDDDDIDLIIDSDSSSPATGMVASEPSSTLATTGVEADDASGSPNLESDEEAEAAREQATVGRLASMSLMAAVTASGVLDEDVQLTFVSEVQRVAKDDTYFVRQEAAFALGALAKVVPEEVVFCSLLPLFEDLRKDAVWHVRHSTLFALPAILSRLPPKRRRELALDTIIPLSKDETPDVRLGVLEALGEVMYTFHQDENGPPDELVKLFLGPREDRRSKEVQQPKKGNLLSVEGRAMTSPAAFPISSPFAATKHSVLDAFEDDPSRALVCAFNYPAVSLTLGRDRWDALRESYLDLVENREVGVRRTIAASLGELAQIVGPEHARKDLIGVWFDAVRCEEGEVRIKAVENVEKFVEAVKGIDTNETSAGAEVVEELLRAWDDDVFKGWREREGVAKAIDGLARLVGQKRPDLVRDLLMKVLDDDVAAVREMAISSIPRILKLFADRPAVVDDLQSDLSSFAWSKSYRKRMTFVACQHSLIPLGEDEQTVMVANADFWKAIIPLAHDNVPGVRIRVARLVADVCDAHARQSQPITGVLLALYRHLSQDASHDVRSFLPGQAENSSSVSGFPTKHYGSSSMFSRPPLRTA